MLHYVLLNGCPSLVIPARTGAPLLAWDGRTLAQLWEVALPGTEGGQSADGRFEEAVDILFEFLGLCIDWDRVVVEAGADTDADGRPNKQDGPEEVDQGKVATADAGGGARAKEALKDAIALLVAAAIRSKESKDARRELDADRSGITMWRIP